MTGKKMTCLALASFAHPHDTPRVWRGRGGGDATNLPNSNTFLIPRAEESKNFIQESTFLGRLTGVLQTTGKGRRGHGLERNFVVRMDNQLRQFVSRLHGWWVDSKRRQHLDHVLGPGGANSKGQNDQRQKKSVSHAHPLGLSHLRYSLIFGLGGTP
jgi:hypothetical protein